VLTLFTIPKPFKGHIDVTQRNTLKSWTRLHPDVEVIVFGAEEGSAEVCRELGLRRQPDIECSEFGTPYLNYAFNRAQEIARHDWLCYSNCDILLMSDFVQAFKRLRAWRDEFLMIGQRWDTDITEPLDFDSPDWERSLRETAFRCGRQRGTDWIDYFAFRRGRCAGLPRFVVGRPCWDHWLIWWMRHCHFPVVDASQAVVAVHQNHDYSYHPEGMKGAREGPEFKRNRALAGSWRHLNTIEDATHVLEAGGIRRTYRHWGNQLERERTNLRNRLLVATGPARRRLGLRKDDVVRLFGRPHD
jgi:hypothetical protein